MKDFLLTPSGDILFVESRDKANNLKIKMFLSKANVLRLNFDMNTQEENIQYENSLILSFNMLEIKNDKKALLVSDDAFLMQQVLIRLQTTLGELKHRRYIGSKLETIIHSDLHDPKTAEKIKQIVSDSIKDLISNFTIDVLPVIDKGEGYMQSMNITVTSSSGMRINYKMGW